MNKMVLVALLAGGAAWYAFSGGKGPVMAPDATDKIGIISHGELVEIEDYLRDDVRTVVVFEADW
jgi:hypothetical protein